MKILHITDSHATVKGPESRKDIYYIAFLKKMYELGYMIKHEKIDYVIHTGDLFHTARVSDKFAGQTAEMIKMWGVPVYVVPGNHDIEGYSVDTIDQTKLGLLAKTGVVTILDRDNPIRFQETFAGGEILDVAITGQEYYAHIDEGNMDDFKMSESDGDINILCIHGYIADTPQHPDIKCTYAKDIITDADIILTGHYHRQFEIDLGDTMIYNPGSMMRIEQTDYNKGHTPAYGILDIHLDNSGSVEYDYQFHTFKIAQPSTIIFDYETKYKQKIASITLEGFKTSLANTMNTSGHTTDMTILLNNLITDPGSPVHGDTELYSETMDLYNNALSTMPETFEVKQGYIEDPKKKKIKSVEIHNFQSHENTNISFSEEMNVITGESNSGKTSILRAIMWAVDNQPLGNDFMMAGGDDNCYVRINYTDGTFIERGRTKKDTGYYIVGDAYSLNKDEYRGFTNAVPVQVDNMHQMPKVSITKDMETHLNVLSQLDSPFLIGESPAVKAAAIGRITGVHVLDASIKDATRQISSNRLLIKGGSDRLQKKKDEKAKLPDVALMKKMNSLLHRMYEYVKDVKQWTDKIQKTIELINDVDIKIDLAKADLSRCITFLNAASRICMLMPKVQAASKLDGLYNNYMDIQKRIDNTTDSVDTSENMLRILPAAERASNTLKHIRMIDGIFDKNTVLTIKICDAKLTAYNNSRFIESMGAVCAVIENKLDYVNTLTPMVNDYLDICGDISNTEQNIKNEKSQVKLLKAKIKQATLKQNEIILSSGVCPCCGQDIKEEHADRIRAFMKGEG